jgi:ketosteroid isomerase-like protein
VAQTIAPVDAADRLAIRELIDAYAHCADRRDAEGQMALFTEDTAFHVFMDARSPTATYVLHGRDALAPVFADLNQYAATTHSMGKAPSVWMAIGRLASAIASPII